MMPEYMVFKDGNYFMEYGIQMYSLRDLTNIDLDASLRVVAGLGYKKVEFAGFFGHTAEEVRAMLDKYNLVCSGTHTMISELANDFDGTVKFHKIIGNKKFIIPGHDLSTRTKLDEFVELCIKYQPMLKEQGIELGYHNHSHEFVDMPEGNQIHKELETRTDIFFELDTYWAYVAKLDPVATMERLKNRIKCIHLKDGSPEGIGCSLGSGSAPVAAVRAKAIEYGWDIIVESEGLNPSGTEEVSRCIGYLHTLD